MDVIIPDPGLIVLVGPAGAGKSTFAARHFAPDEILSSDRFRAIVAGDEADQRATRAAFARLHEELSTRLAAGRLTVVDATNLERTARRALTVRARAAGIPAIAIVLDLPPATVLDRNAARPRIVDALVVARHLERLRHAINRPPTAWPGEGFAGIVVLRDPAEVDRVRIHRRLPETGRDRLAGP